MNPGEYVSPLVRKTQVMCPVVSGYVTSRLLAQDSVPPSASGTPATIMSVTFENVGNTQFAVNLNETSDYSTSGVRYALNTSPVNLVPGGMVVQKLDGYRPYLEVYCTGTTTGNLRMQIDAQRRWTELGFNKDDAFYPPQLFQATEIPGVHA